MNIYQVKENAIETGRMVFTAQSLSPVLSSTTEVARVYLKRLVDKGLAERLINGVVSFTQDDFVISSQLYEPSYVSLFSALHFHGLILQVPSVLQCISSRNTRTFPSLGIEYHKVNPTYFFGYTTISRSNSYYFMATPEKALLDCIYLKLIDELLLTEVLPKMERKIWNSQIKRYPQRFKKWLK